MTALVAANGITKYYGKDKALDHVTLSVEPGQIIGLLGPNGAGKTTLLQTILGLQDCQGELTVLGQQPKVARSQLMEHVSFIADVAVLPRWMRVRDAVNYVQSVHPRFDIQKAHRFLEGTKIPYHSKIRTLSKGMVVQLHLALIMAIDAKLLILDEPTLGLDILYRKTFYQSLINDYFNEERTIIISTHQVEEIEKLLTRLVFLNQGNIILDQDMETFHQDFTHVIAHPDHIDELKSLSPIAQQVQLGKHVFLFEGVDHSVLTHLGDITPCSASDVFIAKVKGENA